MSPSKRAARSQAGAGEEPEAADDALPAASHARSTPGRRASSGMHRGKGAAAPATPAAEASALDASADNMAAETPQRGAAAAATSHGKPAAQVAAASSTSASRPLLGNWMGLLALILVLLNMTLLRPALPIMEGAAVPDTGASHAAVAGDGASASPGASAVPSEALVDAVVERLLVRLTTATPSVAPDSTLTGPEANAAKARAALAASLLSADTLNAMLAPMQDEITTWVAEEVAATVKATTGGWEGRLLALEARPTAAAPAASASGVSSQRLEEVEDAVAGIVDSVALLADVDPAVIKGRSAGLGRSRAAATTSSGSFTVRLPGTGVTVEVAEELSRLGASLEALHDAHDAIAATSKSVSDRTDRVEQLAKTTIARLDKVGGAITKAEAVEAGLPSSAEMDSMSREIGALQEASLDAADELQEIARRLTALDARSKFTLDVLVASGLWNLVVRPSGARNASASNTTVLGESAPDAATADAAPDTVSYGGEAEGGYTVLALDPLDRPAFPTLDQLLTLNQTVEVLMKQVEFVLSLSSAPGEGEGGEGGAAGGVPPPAYSSEEGVVPPSRRRGGPPPQPHEGAGAAHPAGQRCGAVPPSPPEGGTCGAAGLTQRLESLEQSVNLIADEVEALSVKVDGLDSIDYDGQESEEGDEGEYDEYGRPLVAEKAEPTKEGDVAAQKEAHAKHRRRTSNSILRQLDRLAIRVKEMSQVSEEVQTVTKRTATTVKELKEQYEGTVMHTSRGLEDATDFLASLELQVAALAAAAGAADRAAEAVVSNPRGAAVAATVATTAYTASVDADGGLVFSTSTALGFTPDLGSFDPNSVPIPGLGAEEGGEEGGEATSSPGSVRALASVRDVFAIVNAALAAYEAGGAGGALPNLAQARSGAAVAYVTPDGYELTSIGGVTVAGPALAASPDSVLESPRGACWPVPGASGGVFAVRLPAPAFVSGLTLEHPGIAAVASADAAPASTLASFRVYGVIEQGAGEPPASATSRVDLLAHAAAVAAANGTAAIEAGAVAAPPLAFDAAGPVVQTFLLPVEVGPFTVIQLEVEANGGHLDWTCLYRLQVHGRQ